MLAWRLGRFVGSLLVLAGLAVGGFAAHAGPFGAVTHSDRPVVADSDAPTPETPIADPESGYAAFGWTWD